MIFIDFETYSEVDIKERGGKAYAMDDSTQIVCLGYAVNNEPITLWTASAEPPTICKNIEAGEKVYAFNATFDWRIWNLIGVRDFGWPRLSPGQLVDAQALCATYQIPQNLDAAGEALNIKHKKDKGGKDLVKKCCQPNKHGEQPMPTDVGMRVAFNDLFRYCVRDVDAMREIVYKLPRQELLPEEQRIWEFTLEMNELGLPIDATAVISICSHLEEYIERTAKSLPLLTDGKVCTPGQIAKIINWCRSKGAMISNLQAETVENTLEQDLPDEVRRILELRQELGRSSTAKYKKIKAQMVYTDAAGWRVYDNLRYHGAGTGRWTGQGFQMHNLPRAKVENPEEYIQKFIDGYPVENPVGTAKALIRPMIKAPKGTSLLVADYSSIENRILAWAADDFQTLKDFEEGKDQYKTMAASRFGVPYDKVDDEQRRVGKVIILGCGYGMGGKKFKDTAKLQAGLDMTLEEAAVSVNAYRDRYPEIKALWANLKTAATRAVMTGQRQAYKNVTFGVFARNGIRWLAMQLPTGKALYYNSPTVSEMLIPDYEYMGSVPTITHWGTDPYTKKWSRLKLIPGRITENMVQGTAREVMAYGMLNAKKHMPYLEFIGSVHDEAIAICPNGRVEEALPEFGKRLCEIDFLPGCPIEAKSFSCERYRKD